MDTQDHTQAGAVPPDKDTADAAKQTRVRSRIEFPYTDIGQAEELTRTLHHTGGGSAEPNQLASWMDHTATGGTFRSRLSGARLFGFVEVERGMVTITQLGKDATDESKQAAARVTAFLNIPLFEAMYDRLKGYPLPPAAAIERQMKELGVPEKQKERARQVFQKSANIAQFVDPSSGRFVKPAVKDAPSDADEDDDKGKGKGGPGGGDGYHPFIQGLLKELPETGTSWSSDERVKWLRLAVSAFDMIYKDGNGDEITIALTPNKTAAQSPKPPSDAFE